MCPLPRLVALTTVLLLAPLARGEASNAELARAERMLEELRYNEASRALEAARARPGNAHATLVRILELQGVVAAMLHQPAKAYAAFQALVAIEPEHQLTGDYAPRVMTPFFEAKGWVADLGALRLEAAPAAETQSEVERLAVKVTADPLQMGHTVRFHLLADNAPWSQQDTPLFGGDASVAVKAGRVRWWAELLDERQAVLATVGSATEPLLELSPQQEALSRPMAPPPKLEPSSSPLRTVAAVCLGVAAGTGAAGGYFGLRSRSARSELENAPVDERGVTTGLTQREAQALDTRARSSARLANLLLGVAGATAVAGGTLWVLGRPVTVAATPTGVTVEGTLP